MLAAVFHGSSRASIMMSPQRRVRDLSSAPHLLSAALGLHVAPFDYLINSKNTLHPAVHEERGTCHQLDCCSYQCIRACLRLAVKANPGRFKDRDWFEGSETQPYSAHNESNDGDYAGSASEEEEQTELAAGAYHSRT